MGDVGLLAQKLGERFEMREILRFTDAAWAGGRHGVLDRVKAEVFHRPVGLGAKLDALVEVLHPLVVEYQRRHEGDDGKRCRTDANQQFTVVADDKVGETIHGALRPLGAAGLFDAIGQDRQQCGQQGNRVQPGRRDTDRGDVAEVPVRGRIGEVQRKKAHDGCDRCDRYRQEVNSYRLDDRVVLVHAVAQQSAQRQQDVNRVRYRQCQDDDRCRHRDRRELDAEVTGDAHTDHR